MRQSVRQKIGGAQEGGQDEEIEREGETKIVRQRDGEEGRDK